MVTDATAPADTGSPAFTDYDRAVEAHRDAAHGVRIARIGLARTIHLYGYGRSSDAAATRVREAVAHLDAHPHPDAR